MFQKTRWQLTILNSIVFIVLLAILSRAVYWYTETQIYKEVNGSLIKMLEEDRPMKGKNPQGRFLIGPEPSSIIWGPDQQIIEPVINENNPLQGKEKELYPTVFNSVEEVKAGDANFRSLAAKLQTSYGEITIQFIRNVDSEKALLNRLMLILLVGSGIGSLVAIGAGYFLAGRALVPIKKTWDNQQRFVSDASHEIRTPLAVIQAKTELLFQSPGATVEEKAVDISIISNEVRRLNKLVNSLLTLARSDSNQIELNKTHFLLNEEVDDIVLQYEDIAEYQGKKIKNNTTEKDILFVGDRERIHQLLVILVDNAMKFTSDGGVIALSCSKTASSVILKVEDNGKGIPEQEIPNIFNRFYQIDTSRNANQGAGLGLSIAKWIVDIHLGTIKVKSEPGLVTSFEVTLPAK
ncbi:HAMP domain-containing sensor histidine kinase [Peribacillus psychrosaccharolyticus]|uniref:sensor histidine kinase n=1 Tax=Peribacillus psychrosaccharolyticus TaxID=1407 RepID=UPI003D2E23C9